MKLLGDGDSSFHPTLAATATLTQIFIAANDGTRGEFEFPEEYRFLSVNESAQMIEIPISRAYGAYGDVSVFIYSQTSSNALLDQDYEFEAREIYFSSGVSVRVVNATILEDSSPETDEVFELVLASPKGGATLGQYKTCRVTITENDGAGGVIQFVSNDTVTLQESFAADGYPTSVELELSRGPGTFGAVDISYVVIDELGGETTQIQPSSGTISFSDQQASAVISLSVIDDSVPELSQSVTVSISAEYDSLLGVITHRELVILQSDSPNGLLSIYTDTNSTYIDIEEQPSVVTCNIYRTGGLLGDISVSVVTEPLSASARSGSDLHVATVQQFDFTASGYCALGDYLMALNVVDVDTTGSSTSRLYKLEGSYRHVADISVSGAVQCVSYYDYDQQYIVIISQGSAESVSLLYSISQSGVLSKLENIPTRGAVSAAVYRSDDSTYITILNSVNSDNEPQSFTLQNYVAQEDRLILSSQLQLVSAVSVQTVADMVIVAQRDSVKIYSVSADMWTLSQTIPVDNVVDIAVRQHANSVLLIIVTNSHIRVYSLIESSFSSLTDSPYEGVDSVAAFTLIDTLMVSVSSDSGSSILVWNNTNSELSVQWRSNSTQDLVPLSTGTGAGGGDREVMLGSLTDGVSTISLISLLDNPDYIPR